MSLNNLHLPEMLIADLYKNNLLSIDQPPKKEKVPMNPAPVEVPTLKYLGKCLKKTVVLVKFPKEIYLPDNHLTFLANVLKACNLTLADIAIINLAKQEVTLDMVTAVLSPVKILFFEVDPAAIHIDQVLPVFSIKDFQSISLLRAPALEKLNQNNEEGKLLKSKLWLCLKELFSV